MNLWLIQTGKFKNVEKADITGINSLISFTYMGSAEFEFGSLPQSLNRILDANREYGFIRVDDIKNQNGEAAYVYGIENKQDDLKAAVKHLSEDDYGYKEPANMESYIKGKQQYAPIDFWWDIENDFFVIFGEYKKQLLQEAIDQLLLKRKQQ